MTYKEIIDSGGSKVAAVVEYMRENNGTIRAAKEAVEKYIKSCDSQQLLEDILSHVARLRKRSNNELKFVKADLDWIENRLSDVVEVIESREGGVR